MPRRRKSSYSKAEVLEALKSNPGSVEAIMGHLGEEFSIPAKRRLIAFCRKESIETEGTALSPRELIKWDKSLIEKLLAENPRLKPDTFLSLLKIEASPSNVSKFLDWCKHNGILPSSYFKLSRTAKVSDQQVVEAVKDSLTVTAVCRKLELSTNSGSINWMSQRIRRLNLDTSHFTRKGIVASKVSSRESIGIHNPQLPRRIDPPKLREFLISNGVKNECSECALSSWNGKIIKLEIDHRNGNWKDNRLDNLRMLCPNCHSQTSSWRGRVQKPKEKPRICKGDKTLLKLNPPNSARVNSAKLRVTALDAGLKYECSICQLTQWQKKPITLELDHINGTHWDNRLENLRFLCGNCHSQTNTWRKPKEETVNHHEAWKNNKEEVEKRKQEEQKRLCIECQTTMTTKPGTRCGKCNYRNHTRIQWPSTEELLERLKTVNFVQLAKELGVSDNAIRKRIKSRPVSPSGSEE